MRGLIPTAQLFLKRNSATILTCLGAGGVVLTAVLTAKATPKAVELLEEAKKEKGEDLTLVEKVTVAGPTYIPAVIAGTSTITCIFGANVLNKRQQASLMSAYALLDSRYKLYKNKVDEVVDEETSNTIRNAVMEEEYSESDIYPEEGEDLFFDFLSMRYFNSTLDNVMRAEYTLNQLLKKYGYVTLNTFYEMVGAEPVDYGYDIGWSRYDEKGFTKCSEILFDYDKTKLEDGMECYILMMIDDPMNGYLY